MEILFNLYGSAVIEKYMSISLIILQDIVQYKQLPYLYYLAHGAQKITYSIKNFYKCTLKLNEKK